MGFQPSPFGKLRAGSAGLNSERVVLRQKPLKHPGPY